MRKLIIYLILGYLGYEAYEMWSIRQDPVFLKAQECMKAVWDDDRLTLHAIAADGVNLTISSQKIKGHKRWDFDRVLSRTVDERGVETLRISESLRYDLPGQNTFFGEHSANILHTIVLQSSLGQWKVRSYESEEFSDR